MDAINIARGCLIGTENARDTQVSVGKGALRLDRNGAALMSACGRGPFTLTLVSRS